jgi:hypothetical protein
MTDWENYASHRELGRNRLIMPHHKEVLSDFINFFKNQSLDTKILDVGCGS